MRYRVYSGPWINYTPKEEVEPLHKKGNVVIVIDPAKGNMAIVIGNTAGTIYTYLEISGTGNDTSEYCEDFRNFLRSYLRNVKVVWAGVEEAVGYKGMSYYTSQMVLTEIRANIINFFLTTYNVKPMEINNWSWKSAILPDGYRSTKEKGSLRYLQGLGMVNVTHDVTDAICMYMYSLKNYNMVEDLYCEDEESTDDGYKLIIYDDKVFGDVPSDMWSVPQNPSFSLTNNVHYILNRTTSDGVITTHVENLALEDFYINEVIACTLNTRKVKVVVLRTS